MDERSHEVLDPRSLGRPVHLLGRYTQMIQRALAEIFQLRLNRRYRSRFEITQVRFEHEKHQPSSRRWLTFDVGEPPQRHPMAFSIDRGLLLCLLAYRYGAPQPPPQSTSQAGSQEGGDAASRNPSLHEKDTPETATEERLAVRLGCQFLGVLAASVEALETGQSGGAGSAASAAPTPGPSSVRGGWILRAGLIEHDSQLEGEMHFCLDDAWMTRLLRALTPARQRAGKSGAAAGNLPLPSRLPLTLSTRLLEKQISLGALLDLRIGDVIPATLGNAQVLVDDSCLFTASIAEHKGKLCLTSFEDVERT